MSATLRSWANAVAIRSSARMPRGTPQLRVLDQQVLPDDVMIVGHLAQVTRIKCARRALSNAAARARTTCGRRCGGRWRTDSSCPTAALPPIRYYNNNLQCCRRWIFRRYQKLFRPPRSPRAPRAPRYGIGYCSIANYGMIRYGVMRCGGIRYATVWHDIISYDVLRVDVSLHGTIRYYMLRHASTRRDAARYDAVLASVCYPQPRGPPPRYH